MYQISVLEHTDNDNMLKIDDNMTTNFEPFASELDKHNFYHHPFLLRKLVELRKRALPRAMRCFEDKIDGKVLVKCILEKNSLIYDAFFVMPPSFIGTEENIAEITGWLKEYIQEEDFTFQIEITAK